MKDIAIWLQHLSRWATMQGMKPFMFGRLPAAPTADEQRLIRDEQRYLHAAIENNHLADDLADIPDITDAPTAIEHIRLNWLSGRHVTDVLQDELDTITYSEGTSLQTFLSEFALLVNNIEPIIPSRRACELFAERMPSSFDIHVQAADTDPGRTSANDANGNLDHRRSFRAWANRYVSEAQKVHSRESSPRAQAWRIYT